LALNYYPELDDDLTNRFQEWKVKTMSSIGLKVRRLVITVVVGLLGLPSLGLSQATTTEARLVLKHKESLTAMALSPDGKTLISAVCDDKGKASILLWDVPAGKERLALKTSQIMIMSLALRSDGRILASASYDGSLNIWDVGKPSLVSSANDKLESPASISFQPNSKTLVTQTSGGCPVLWNTEDLSKVRPFAKQPFRLTESLSRFALSKDGKRIALASGWLDGTNDIFVFDLNTGQKLKTFKGPNNLVNELAFSNEGLLLAAGFLYGNRGHKMIQVWDTSTGKPFASLEHKGGVCSLTFAPDDSALVAGNNVGKISVWNMRTKEQKEHIDAHRGQVFDLVFSPDGNQLVSAGHDRTIKIWEMKRKK
jgi:WD40 repeat protein